MGLPVLTAIEITFDSKGLRVPATTLIDQQDYHGSQLSVVSRPRNQFYPGCQRVTCAHAYSRALTE
jgi:hypothetical protein